MGYHMDFVTTYFIVLRVTIDNWIYSHYLGYYIIYPKTYLFQRYFSSVSATHSKNEWSLEANHSHSRSQSVSSSWSILYQSKSFLLVVFVLEGVFSHNFYKTLFTINRKSLGDRKHLWQTPEKLKKSTQSIPIQLS